MKAGIFIAAALVQIAAAQPHHHNHQNVHEKRQVFVTDVTYATVTAAGPDVIVYVNAQGKPVSTSTVHVPTTSTPEPSSTSTPEPSSTSTPEPASTSASLVVAADIPTAAAVAYTAPSAAAQEQTTAAAPTTEAAPATTEAPAPEPTTAAPVQSSAPVSSSPPPSNNGGGNSGNAGGNGVGIVYSPYTNGGQCKTQDQVNTDFAGFKGKGYSLVRIYGTDCNQVSTVGSAVRDAGMKLFAGIFSINDVASEAQIIIDASNGDFSYIDTISVGNELVNTGAASASQVVAALNQARGILNGAGYSGSMVIVDTFNAVIANPSICEASDYAAVNAHPFFDSGILPGAAGVWVVGTKALVETACGGKRTVITETGMPWGGQCNGLMCPSYAGQASAIGSIKSAMPNGGYIVLSAYNDLWKQNAQWNFFAEQSWGLYGDAPSS